MFVPSAGVQVYPRVGGGNAGAHAVNADIDGLSPRGRGKLLAAKPPMRCTRSIPAWAGETPAGLYTLTNAAVYPRVGGGNRTDAMKRCFRIGLSPRGRGKLCQVRSSFFLSRSIPAWAGETRQGGGVSQDRRVYPRVGGGNMSSISCTLARIGLSPRGRGKPGLYHAVEYMGGSIPAWAGETRLLLSLLGRSTVYPRVGGGNQRRRILLYHARGLSPRGRGKLLRLLPRYGYTRSIPAWAGET